MARTAITVTETSRAGVAVPAQQAGDNAENMKLSWNDGKIVLELEASGGACTFTFPVAVPASVDGQAIASKEVVLAEGEKKVVGPFPPGVYNRADGTVNVNVSTAKGKIRAYHLN